ncbi:MAG: hypothetical protein ACI4VP_02190 [Clostridia bacterium]
MYTQNFNNQKIYQQEEILVDIFFCGFKVKGYNNIADLCYRKLKKNDKIFINGKIETNMIINIKNTTVLY